MFARNDQQKLNKNPKLNKKTFSRIFKNSLTIKEGFYGNFSLNDNFIDRTS